MQVLAFYPEAAIDPWDAIEIDAVFEDEDGNCEVVTDSGSPISYYSVYLHQVKGGVQCVADLSTMRHAQDLAELLEEAVKSNEFNPDYSLF
jgi:hypothetical protein